MARWSPVPVAGGSYADDCLPFSSQDAVNYLYVPAESEGTRSEAYMRGLPGCTTFSVTGSDAPVRGTYDVEGKLLTVSGNALYRIGTDGAATSIGTIPGTGRVSFAHNQITAGNEVGIANGLSGYIYNTATGALTQITDEGFPGAKVFGFIDGFLMYVEPRGRFWGWSDLAAGTSYNTLDRSEAEAQPDLIVTGVESHGEWLVLGQRTGEFYRNTGATLGTFQRIEGTDMQVGCAGTHMVAKCDNSVFFMGNDGIFYRVEGYQPVRKSRHSQEQAWSRCNLANGFMTVFEDQGHKIIYVTCPDGETLGYDVSTDKWHRRESFGLNRWRMSSLTRWNGKWIAGDYSNGRLYQLDWAVQHEAGQEMERRRRFAIMHDGGNALTVNAVRFEFDTGLASESQSLLADLTISGSLPDGIVGDTGTYQYASNGGVLPHSFDVASGALPTGATMNATGLVTYTYSAGGTFSWTPRVTDSETPADTATLNDSATIMLRAWLAAFSPSGSDTLRRSPNGTDWSSAGFNPGGSSSTAAVYLARSGLEILRTTTDNLNRFSADAGVTWTACTGLSVSGGGGQAVKFGGYWHVQDTTNKVQRSANGLAYAAVATAPEATAISGTGSRLIGLREVGVGWVYRADDAEASAWTRISDLPTAFLPSGSAMDYGNGVLGLATCNSGAYGGGGTNDYRAHILKSTTDGVSWTEVANPFPDQIDPASANALRIHYDATLALWAVTFFDRVAYGATLDTLALSAHVFPQWVYGLDSDGTKFMVSGPSGMLESSANGNAWTAQTSGVATTIWDVTFAPIGAMP